MKTDRATVEALLGSPWTERSSLIATTMLALLAEKEAAEKALEEHGQEWVAKFMYDDLIAKLAVAEAARDASQVDADRLDWLDTQREPIVNRAPDGEPELIAYGWGVQGQNIGVREAIDAARKETGNG